MVGQNPNMLATEPQVYEAGYLSKGSSSPSANQNFSQTRLLQQSKLNNHEIR